MMQIITQALVHEKRTAVRFSHAEIAQLLRMTALDQLNIDPTGRHVTLDLDFNVNANGLNFATILITEDLNPETTDRPLPVPPVPVRPVGSPPRATGTSQA